MRMWGVDPALLCDRHLLGEHVEMHMFAGTIKKGISTAGYEETGLVDLSKLASRHDALAKEMGRRGMKHKSPLDRRGRGLKGGWIDRKANLAELARRCTDCKKRIHKARRGNRSR